MLSGRFAKTVVRLWFKSRIKVVVYLEKFKTSQARTLSKFSICVWLIRLGREAKI